MHRETLTSVAEKDKTPDHFLGAESCGRADEVDAPLLPGGQSRSSARTIPLTAVEQCLRGQDRETIEAKLDAVRRQGAAIHGISPGVPVEP
jgi:hypothetical protein